MKAFLWVLLPGAAALPAAAASLDMPMVKSPLAPKPAQACAALAEKTAQTGAEPLQRLDKLPQGLPILAVLRTVDGCPVIEVRYGGRNVWVAPSIPSVKPAAPGKPGN